MNTLLIEGLGKPKGVEIEDIKDLPADASQVLLRALWQVVPVAVKPPEPECERAYEFAIRAARDIAWQFRIGDDPGQVWIKAPVEGGKETGLLLRKQDLASERSFLLIVMPLLSLARRDPLPGFDPAWN